MSEFLCVSFYGLDILNIPFKLQPIASECMNTGGLLYWQLHNALYIRLLHYVKGCAPPDYIVLASYNTAVRSLTDILCNLIIIKHMA